MAGLTLQTEHVSAQDFYNNIGNSGRAAWKDTLWPRGLND